MERLLQLSELLPTISRKNYLCDKTVGYEINFIAQDVFAQRQLLFVTQNVHDNKFCATYICLVNIFARQARTGKIRIKMILWLQILNDERFRRLGKTG